MIHYLIDFVKSFCDNFTNKSIVFFIMWNFCPILSKKIIIRYEKATENNLIVTMAESRDPL